METPSAVTTARRIRDAEVSATEVLEEHLATVDRLNPQINAVCYRDDEGARASARELDDAIAAGRTGGLGPFAGVPMLIKDLNHVRGWPTTYGSRAVSEDPQPADNRPVALLRDAGFLFTGKTATPEFGSVPVTESARLGETRNPWNTDHTPGGSSGGAGAAVAAGMVPAAHGSDGGGSIRIPSSCNGLVGMKPSRHRVVNDSYNMGGVSTQGILTTDVADTAAILDVMSVPDRGAWAIAPPLDRPLAEEVGAPQASLRIRMSFDSVLGSEVSDECREATQIAAAALEDLGHTVDTDPLVTPDPALVPAFLTTWSAITAGTPLDVDLLEPHNKAARLDAEATSAITYAEGLLELQRTSRAYVAQFGSDFDLLLSPTLAIEPPKVGWLFADPDQDPRTPLAMATPMAAFTALFNVTGQPAISLPVHQSVSGLPVGIQLAGSPFDEATLIRVASQLEEVFGWQNKTAPLR